MYHISDLKDFVKCPRSYYLKDDNKDFMEFFRSDCSLTELLLKRDNITNTFVGKRGDSTSRFKENEDKYDVFERVRFEDDELRVTVNLMIKNGDGYDVYFSYYRTVIKDIDVFTYNIILNVLKRNGIKVKDMYLVYPNPDYVFKRKLDLKKAIVVTCKIDNKRLVKIVKRRAVNYKNIIETIKNHTLDDYPPTKCHKCRGRVLCKHYYTCFESEKDLPEDSIMYLNQCQYKDEMLEKGIVHAKDADPSLIEGSKTQYAQIMASKNGGLFVDKYVLKNWMKCLDSYPISFVDFEWDSYLIPKYKGMKALDVLPFEYVLYTISKEGKLNNKSFVGNLDARKDFLKSLLRALPRKGPIVAYNAHSAEVIRLKELAKVYPLYRRKINSVCKRFVDISEPFINGIVYDSRLRGNYSLKAVLEVVSDKSYSDFEISNGLEAVRQYRQLDLGKAKDEKKIVEDLKEYCGLDAFALYLVYKWLKEKID